MVNGYVVNPTASLNKNKTVTTDFYPKTVNSVPPPTLMKWVLRDLTDQIVCLHFMAETLHIPSVMKV